MKIQKLFTTCLALFASTGSLIAGELTVPNSFSANTTAVAADVNANFNAVKAAVDDNDTRITANISDINANTSNIAINTSDISALNSQLTSMGTGYVGAHAAAFATWPGSNGF